MAANSVIERDEHGWFKAGEPNYSFLLKSKAVQFFEKSWPVTARGGQLHYLKWFLDYVDMGPEEFLGLSDEEVKNCIKRACLLKVGEEKYSASRRVFYVAKRFLEINGREVNFNRSERGMLLKRIRKKLGREYIPSREEIYRMVDAVPDKGFRQQLRERAILLCLWQSGVRASCLCSWRYGMFRDQLWPSIKVPLRIKVLAHRPRGINDCAVDRKLSSYGMGYYYTFLHEEAAKALRDYLDARMRERWTPRDSDPVFVTEGSTSQDKPISSMHLIEIVKNMGKQIGIDPDSIWTHCIRKSFRKALYRAGVDNDVAEALMGHKLAGSKTSYFDYKDVALVEKEYLSGFWGRISVSRITHLEEEVGGLRGIKEEMEALREENKDLKERINGIAETRRESDNVMDKLFEDPEFRVLLRKKLKELI
jgi:integrase